MASTTAPPKIDDQLLPSTPSHEWANDILNAQSNTLDRMAINSATSTPGIELPGAYPRDAREQDAPQTGGHAQEGSGVLDAAKQYIPAQEDVQKVLMNVGETAKQYLPQSLASYFPGSQPTTSLPSQENELTRSDGVGSLPGNASESAVALLPDEREKPVAGDSTPKHETLDTSVLTPATNRDTQTRQESISNVSTQAEDGSEYTSEKSTPGFTPTLSPTLSSNIVPSKPTGGIGDLPGSRTESSVAMTPEERNTASSEHQGTVSDPTSTSISKISAVASPNSTSTATSSPVADQGLSTNSDSSPSRFAENDPVSNDSTKLVSVTSGESGGTSGSNSSQSSTRKSKFMDKVKGEVKVITGKLGGNEEKVQEGKKLMGFGVRRD
ncbi:hypothetical protein VKT23_010851 [Stygiomarasmius scandens]|uniref:Uncharacterized protein n=1 Tax=Marasmiellus scandens TaxID=2682957 RepID=A0ABR1JAE7_9AGAR